MGATPEVHPDDMPVSDLDRLKSERFRLRCMIRNDDAPPLYADLPGGVAGALARIEAAIKRMEASS